MELKHNPRSFLTGDEPFMNMTPVVTFHNGFEASLLFEQHHEGFIGIPHGGLAMGLCLDAWRTLKGPAYPVHARRFGGRHRGRSRLQCSISGSKQSGSFVGASYQTGGQDPLLER